MAQWRAENGREEIGPKWRVMENDGTHHGPGGFSGGMQSPRAQPPLRLDGGDAAHTRARTSRRSRPN